MNGALNLSKIPTDSLWNCLRRFQASIEEEGNLVAKDISAIAKLFHPVKKSHLVLEEEMTFDDWQLVAKKFKLKPEALAPIKQQAEQLALHETVFTDDAVNALSQHGYDPLLVLPKPKKKYSDRDLAAKVDEAVEPYKQEKEYWQQECNKLQQRIEELNLPVTEDEDLGAIEIEATEIEKNFEEIVMIGTDSPDDFKSDRSNGSMELIYGHPVHCLEKAVPADDSNSTSEELTKTILGECTTKIIYNPQEPDSASILADYLGYEETRLKQKSEGHHIEEGTQEVEKMEYTVPSVTSLKDLKGYGAIASFDGAWKSGELRGQNGTGNTVWFKKAENNKLYSLPFDQVQIQFPVNSDRYQLLSDFIEEHNLKVEDKKTNRGFRDLLSK